jgi:hypothetical protein
MPHRRLENNKHNIGFCALTSVTVCSNMFYDVMPYSLTEVNLCFGGTCRLHLQCWKAKPSKQEIAFLLLLIWIIPSSLKMEAASSSEK